MTSVRRPPRLLFLCINPCPITVGKFATIPANIIIDTPLPIPCSVINSPSHTKKVVPAANDKRTATVSSPNVELNDCSLIPPSRFINVSCPYPCATAIGIII